MISVVAQALSGPLILAALATLGFGGLLLWDLARAHSPRARLLRRIEAMASRFATPSQSESIARELFRRGRRAGRLRDIHVWLGDLSLFIGGRRAMTTLFSLTVVAGLGAAAISAFAGLSGFAAAGLGGVAGMLAFGSVRAELRRRWKVRFLDQLIEAVDLLSRSVQSGHAVPAAIRLVSEETGAPVGPVFRRIADEDDLGVDFRTAMTGAAQRVSISDFTFLTSALMLQRETGGQLASSLDNLRTMLRKRREARLKMQALTAEGRSSANVVGAVPVVACAAVYLMNPESMQETLADPAGRRMFGLAAGLLISGMLIVRAMTRPPA